MATLTADQLRYLRADIGDSETPFAFTTSELNDNFTRSSSNYRKTVILTLEQLLANLSKLYDYKVGFTVHSQAAVYDHVKSLLEVQRSKLTEEEQTLSIVGLSPVPPVHRTEPTDA